MSEDGVISRSSESWDGSIDNWNEFCEDVKGELPKVGENMYEGDQRKSGLETRHRTHGCYAKLLLRV